MVDLKNQVRRILTPELCLAVYNFKYPFAKGDLPSGSSIGQIQFRPSKEYIQGFYDLIYHSALLPLSKLPLDSWLEFDLTELLPTPTSPEYPEHCLGLVLLLDQGRMFTKSYGFRYTRAFFDPACEKLMRKLIAVSSDLRPDGKNAWLSRGYSFDDWVVRTLWFWAPLVHADAFMVDDRQHLKDWLHSMRAEVEQHAGVSDPFAPMEADDDVDITAFPRIEGAGPPTKSYSRPDEEATVSDYAFWWIRILNSHFAITDMCGHYPYWIRWKGLQWTEEDKEFMRKTDNYRYDPATEPILQQVREDYLAGVWQPMRPNMDYEKNNEQ